MLFFVENRHFEEQEWLVTLSGNIEISVASATVVTGIFMREQEILGEYVKMSTNSFTTFNRQNSKLNFLLNKHNLLYDNQINFKR